MKISSLVNYLGWASGIFAALLMLCGIIGFLTGTSFLGVRYFINYFYFASDFLLLGIFLLVGAHFIDCNCKKEEKGK